MRKIEIKVITKENEEALDLPNEPFLEEGRLVPIYDGKNWSYRIDRYPEELVTENCFPDEHYVFEQMGDGFLGLSIYVDGECAGFALLYEKWNKWLYLDNLLVLKKYRRQGLGSALITEAMKLAASKEKRGINLICQDNNLQAAQFYLKNGFVLGGMDLLVYEGTKQEGKADLFFYKRL